MTSDNGDPSPSTAAVPLTPRGQRAASAGSFTPRGLRAARHPGMTSLSHLRNSPKFVFTPRQRERPVAWESCHATPSAGCYEPNDPNTTSRMHKGPQYGFGSCATGRLSEAKREMPGPGAYDHAERLGEKRTFTMGTPRLRERPVAWESKHGTPNPGTYDPENPRLSPMSDKSQSRLFDKASTGRLDPGKPGSPGPGTYPHKVHLGKNNKIVLGTPRDRARPVAWESRHGTPNPGHYDPQESRSAARVQNNPKVGFGGSTSTGRLDPCKPAAPCGPGCYEHKEHLREKTSALLGTPRETARPVAWVSRHCSPSAGHYEAKEPSTTSRMDKSPTFGFGSSSTGRLQQSRLESPGPGSYGGHYTQFT